MKCGFRNDICIHASHALCPLPSMSPIAPFPLLRCPPFYCPAIHSHTLDSAYEKKMWLILLNMMASTASHLPPDDSLPFSCWWARRLTPHRLLCTARYAGPFTFAYLDPRSYKTRSRTAEPWCTSNLSLLSNFPTDVHGGCTNHLQPHQQFPPNKPCSPHSHQCLLSWWCPFWLW